MARLESSGPVTQTQCTRPAAGSVSASVTDCVTLPDGSTRNCLGADDTAGVWLALELIRRQIAGRYVFHFGEERGGIGSGMLAHRHPDWLAECQMAIALDRAGYDEVITHQGGNRTASGYLCPRIRCADRSRIHRVSARRLHRYGGVCRPHPGMHEPLALGTSMPIAGANGWTWIT